jgi:hypothetical protein
LTFCFLSFGIAAACQSKQDFPPVLSGTYEAGTIGPGATGGGNPTTENECSRQGGMCTAAGNAGGSGCPIQIPGAGLCGSASEEGGIQTDGQFSGEICCTGYNDAGPSTDDSG